MTHNKSHKFAINHCRRGLTETYKLLRLMHIPFDAVSRVKKATLITHLPQHNEIASSAKEFKEWAWNASLGREKKENWFIDLNVLRWKKNKFQQRQSSFHQMSIMMMNWFSPLNGVINTKGCKMRMEKKHSRKSLFRLRKFRIYKQAAKWFIRCLRAEETNRD